MKKKILFICTHNSARSQMAVGYKSCNEVEKITDEGPLILITCSGVSNTGKLTAQVGGILAQKESDLFEGHLHAKQSTRDMEAVINGGKVVVIDGCGDRCAAKKLKSLCITPYIHIIATEEGIEKNGMADPKFDEIEMLIAAVRREIRR